MDSTLIWYVENEENFALVMSIVHLLLIFVQDVSRLILRYELCELSECSISLPNTFDFDVFVILNTEDNESCFLLHLESIEGFFYEDGNF